MKEWTVQIISKDGKVTFIHDKNEDRYQLIGIMEVEIEMLKKELIGCVIKEVKNG